MKAFIAAAALAAAGTSASAATLTYDFDYVFTGGSFSQSCEFEDPADCGVAEAPDFESQYGGRTLSGTFTVEERPFSTGEVGYVNADIRATGLNVSPPYDDVYSRRVNSYTIGELFSGRTTLSFGSGEATYERGTNVPSFSQSITRNFEIVDYSVSRSSDQDGPEVAPVPLPASAPLLAASLGGLAWWRRRAV